MTEINTSPSGDDRHESDRGVGAQRPDQAPEQPAQASEDPASGPEGSAGAGGPDGFGSAQ